MTIKQWTLRSAEACAAAKAAGMPDLAARVYAARGIQTASELEALLGEPPALSDPFLLCDMDKAVERIHAALEREERIVVYGDYDCDGVTATAILCLYLASVGAEVCYYIPEREMGYGLNETAIRSFANEKYDLILTVDNGISALAESELAHTLGMDLVVTDHHQPGETLPRACAVIDPHRADDRSPCKDLCGVGVALKLIAALEGGSCEELLDFFADLSAIGTVADVVPLREENRTIVKAGLQMLETNERPGLAALLERAGLSEKRLTGDSLAFGLAPRLNAAGRMGSANTALELLLCEEPEEAKTLAERLDALNAERQAEERRILEAVDARLAAEPSLLWDRVLVVSGAGWHHGVLGIVSARLTERYGKPTVVLSVDADGVATGSARSFGAFSLFEMFSACSDLFVRFGGHAHAAGVTLRQEQIEPFRRKINDEAQRRFPVMPRVELTADALATAGELTLQNAAALEALAPFGEQNRQPVLLLRGVTLDAVYPLSENRHLRLKLSQDGVVFYGLLFGVSTDRFLYAAGATLDLAVTLEQNLYQDKPSVSVKIKDVRPSGFDENRFFAAKDVYEGILRGETPDARLKPRILPTRAEIGAVYKLFCRRPQWAVDADTVFLAIANSGLNYCKFRCALDVLTELCLVSPASGGAGYTAVRQTEKKNLEDSAFYHKLNSLWQ